MMTKRNEKRNGSFVNFISAVHMTDVGEVEILVELLR
jgi:hypothetical protein